MPPSVLVILTLAAVVTATVSAIIGMGGGILLLATLFCVLPHGEAVPIHAAVQLASNGTRVLAFVRHVEWAIVGRFAIGAVPGGVAGGLLLASFGEPGAAEPYLKTLIGVYILALTFLPRPSGPTKATRAHEFPLMGFAAGTAALTVGAVGPLIAPLFARRGFVKERLVATKAMCQMFLHVVKIPAFLMLGTIDYGRFATLIVLMAGAAMIGTILGKRILRQVSPATFVRLYRIALTVAGGKVLVFDGLARLLVW
ncbi:MAG: TSUP family transporter [Phycisphaerae bacterium]